MTNLSTGGNGSTVATYKAGNYFSVNAAGLTMPAGIILDAQGNSNATFVFVAGSTINLASGQTITLANGAQAANVVFVAGSSFTSVATSTVNGNILATASITLGGGTFNGRALANNGAVTISAATTVNTTAATGGSASAGLGQIDFAYDGQYYLKFFGANPIPTTQELYPGIYQTNMTPALINILSQTLLATLGIPVPPNVANVPGPAA
jgi:hypothetical protein